MTTADNNEGGAKAQHTPTPWVFLPRDGVIRSPYGEHHRPEHSTQMGDYRGAIVCSLMDGLGTDDALGRGREHALAEFRANAALIVDAVNSHESNKALIATLQADKQKLLAFLNCFEAQGDFLILSKQGEVLQKFRSAHPPALTPATTEKDL